MENFDVVVVGAGPGGYVAAIRSAQLGKKTAIIEREFLGGVCLNVGCIPSKAMISAGHFLHKAQHSAMEMGIQFDGIKVDFPKMAKWKQGVCDKMSGGVSQLLKGNGVKVFMGEAEFTGPNQIKIKSKNADENLSASNIILALGSRPIAIPGFAFDEKNIVSSTGALAFNQLPKSLVVIGGGYIGLEISGYLRKLGTEVTVVEAASSLLSGVVDSECAQVVHKRLTKEGVKFVLNGKAVSQKAAGKEFEVIVDVQGKKETIRAEKILVTVGRRPNGDQPSLQKLGVKVDEKGFVVVNHERRTNLPHVFAIGDLAGQPMLAHKASHEGVLVAEVIAGQQRIYDAKTVPAVVFTDPEIASAGLSEAEARAKGYQDLLVAKFPFAANGRAVSLMETEGFVKMIADKKTHVLLGVHMVGPEVSNLISEAVIAIEMGARLEDLALSIHPHPTLGETMMEAAEATLGHAIHIIQKPLGRGSREATH